MSIRKEVSPMEAPCSSGNAQEQLFITDWAPPIHSISIDSFNVGGSNDANVERLPNISCFGSGSLSEIMNSFNLPENTQLGDFPSTVEEKNFKGKKRKKMPDSTEGENEKNVQTGPVKNTKEEDDKKQKNETGDTNKEDYLHIRARRGQATNSHSLAERVRREKISERMRLLQDLVPGCNKITGKAVMLDEIINYVQSLQSQVEFLSMKLATVNPEMNLDINQIIRKENLHSEYGGSSQILGYFPELVSSLPQLQTGIAVPSLPSSRDLIRTANNLQISSMAQIPSPWDNEIQNALQMSFIPNIPHHGMELNGNRSMKEEL